MAMTTPTRIVIVGGGFAGLYTALELEQAFVHDDRVEITLVDRDNFLLFTPMLAEVVSGSIDAHHIVSPLRGFFRKVRFRDSAVDTIDLERRVLTVSHCPRCEPYELTYDHLVLAPGSHTNFFGLLGGAEHAFPMKNLADALALRNHVTDVLEHADIEPNPARRRPLCTVVVAGGGLAGVETMAELNDFTRRAQRFYPHIRPEELRMVLVHPGERLMPEINAQLAAYAQQQLTRRRVKVRLKTKIVRLSADAVELSDGTVIPSSTLVWTAGTSMHPLVASLPCRKDERARILVNEFLEVPDCPGVWAVGDCAHIPDPKTGQPHPPTAQHAVREGRHAGRNIAATIRGGTKQPFVFATLGQLVPLGRRSAVADILGWRFHGFFAWWLWRTIYLCKLPGLERKVRVALDWTLDLFFPRDITLLKVLLKTTVPAKADDYPAPVPQPADLAQHERALRMP
jgi:NADH:ubiquinone reductase (H+-translocating)